MTIAKKKLEIFVRYWPATENPTSGTSRVLFSKITRPWEVQKDVYVWTVFKPYIFNSRYKLILSSIRMLLNIIFRCKEILVYFQVFSFLRSWKLTFLSPDLSKCNFILNFDFLLFYISLEQLNNKQNLGFKTILTHKPAKNPRYNIHGFDVMLMFPN